MRPLPFTWDGSDMILNKRFQRIADEQFTVGGDYMLAPHEERSEVSHNHEFAWLQSAWETLPDHLQREYPSKEHLRKRALIATGWCTVRDYACTSRAEAVRTASFIERELKDADPYAVVIVSDAVVRVCRARSQARNKMNRADFQASKTAVLEYVAALLGSEPAQLASAAA